jgi:putative flippase GtrA
MNPIGLSSPAIAVGGKKGDGPARRVELTRQVTIFAALGLTFTFVYFVLYSPLRAVLNPLSANAVALLVSSVANTAFNRRLTFGVTGRSGSLRQHAEALVVFGIGLVLTSAALTGLALIVEHPARSIELGVLVVAKIAAAIARFLVFRFWIFRPRRIATGVAEATGAAVHGPEGSGLVLT